MADHHVPDRVEKGIRFGCGFLVGALLGAGWAVYGATHSLPLALAVIGGLSITCGLLASRYGDRFWQRLSDWWWIWP